MVGDTLKISITAVTYCVLVTYKKSDTLRQKCNEFLCALAQPCIESANRMSDLRRFGTKMTIGIF